jgi:2,3-bisphosphoglycerate-independent phosphoglycerate mutase
VIGPLAEIVTKREARLLVLPDAAWETETGRPTADPVPALIWGKGVEALRTLPFHEEGAALAGEPVAPGYGLIEYVRSL